MYWVVIHEGVLRHVVGSPEIMQAHPVSSAVASSARCLASNASPFLERPARPSRERRRRALARNRRRVQGGEQPSQLVVRVGAAALRGGGPPDQPGPGLSIIAVPGWSARSSPSRLLSTFMVRGLRRCVRTGLLVWLGGMAGTA